MELGRRNEPEISVSVVFKPENGLSTDQYQLQGRKNVAFDEKDSTDEVQDEQKSKEISEAAPENMDVDQLLGILGKYLYQKKKRKVKPFKKPPQHVSPRKGRNEMKDSYQHGVKRNWKKLSIHPFINFLREFRKRFPTQLSIDCLQLKAVDVWRSMDINEKSSYFEKAELAKERGYLD